MQNQQGRPTGIHNHHNKPRIHSRPVTVLIGFRAKDNLVEKLSIAGIPIYTDSKHKKVIERKLLKYFGTKKSEGEVMKY